MYIEQLEREERVVIINSRLSECTIYTSINQFQIFQLYRYDHIVLISIYIRILSTAVT